MKEWIETVLAIMLVLAVILVFAFGGVLFIGALSIVFVLAVIGDIIQYTVVGLSSLSGSTKENRKREEE